MKKQLARRREFVEGENLHSFDIFVVEASMNIPVFIDKNEHDTYVWTTADMVEERLTWDNEREAFREALEFIKNDSRKR